MRSFFTVPVAYIGNLRWEDAFRYQLGVVGAAYLAPCNILTAACI